MEQEIIEINNTQIRLTYVVPVVYDPKTKHFTQQNFIFCYWTNGIHLSHYGELLKDEENNPIMFNRRQEAKKYAEEYLMDRV
jgi:hypothetical protein